MHARSLPRYLLESSIFIWGLLRWIGSGDTLMDDGVVGSLGSGEREPSFWGVSASLPFSLYTPSPWWQMNSDIRNIYNQKHKKWKLNVCNITWTGNAKWTQILGKTKKQNTLKETEMIRNVSNRNGLEAKCGRYYVLYGKGWWTRDHHTHMLALPKFLLQNWKNTTVYSIFVFCCFTIYWNWKGLNLF